MSFLSGIFLAALPLIAIPVLIHLYRGRQRDVIPWGAMQFLTQATTKGRSMERFEEMMLLALRVGAIIALVLALAQPMVRSSWWGGGTATEVVLVVDNSLSMSRVVDGVSAWDQMKEQVQETLEGLDRSDRVQIMLASGGGEWLTAEGISADGAGKGRLATLLAGINPTLSTAGLLDGLQRVILSDAERNPKYRRIVVFTDNQVNSWQLEEVGAWRQLESARQNAAMQTSIEIVDCGLESGELNNLAIMRVEVAKKSVQPNEPIELIAEISNVGQTASQSATVQWLIDDEVVSTTDLEGLLPKQSVQNKSTMRIEEVGHYAVTCQIDRHDQIELDHRSSVVVEVTDRLPILLVHDMPLGEIKKSSKKLLLAALGYDGGEAQAWHSLYYPEVVTAAKLAEQTLSNYRCVVITSLSEIEPVVCDRLSEYVNNGGGLWVALGDQTGPQAFNRIWYDEGQGLSPVAIEALKSIDDTNEPAGMIHPPEHEHPATAQLANTTQLDIDEARLFEYWQLAAKGSGSETVSILLSSGDGSPLVVENYLGQGRVLVQAFPLGLEWTNLPQLKSYVVLVHDWLDYLTTGSTARYNLSPGSSIVASPPKGATFATAVLLSPDGSENSLLKHGTSAGTTILRYSQTQQPGLYRVAFKSSADTVVSLPYYVARDTNESLWKEITPEDQEKLAALAELHSDVENSVDIQLAQTATPEEPLWNMLLLALLLFLAGELLLSNWLGRQRSGVAVSTS